MNSEAITKKKIVSQTGDDEPIIVSSTTSMTDTMDSKSYLSSTHIDVSNIKSDISTKILIAGIDLEDMKDELSNLRNQMLNKTATKIKYEVKNREKYITAVGMLNKVIKNGFITAENIPDYETIVHIANNQEFYPFDKPVNCIINIDGEDLNGLIIAVDDGYSFVVQIKGGDKYVVDYKLFNANNTQRGGAKSIFRNQNSKTKTKNSRSSVNIIPKINDTSSSNISSSNRISSFTDTTSDDIVTPINTSISNSSIRSSITFSTSSNNTPSNNTSSNNTSSNNTSSNNTSSNNTSSKSVSSTPTESLSSSSISSMSEKSPYLRTSEYISPSHKNNSSSVSNSSSSKSSSSKSSSSTSSNNISSSNVSSSNISSSNVSSSSNQSTEGYPSHGSNKMRGGSNYKKIGSGDGIGIMRKGGSDQSGYSDSSSPPMEGLCE